jgi:hypothetical protein
MAKVMHQRIVQNKPCLTFCYLGIDFLLLENIVGELNRQPFFFFEVKCNILS